VTHLPVLPSEDVSTSLSFLEEIRGGQPGGWDRLAELYEPLVRHWCRQGGMNDADDAWHEVFLAVTAYIGRFERTKHGAFRCWLRAITRSKVADVRRQAARLGAEGGSDAAHRFTNLPARPVPPDADQPEEETGLLYRRAVELLRKDFADRTWRAFWGVVVEARSPADVAADLGLTRNAVFQARARVLLRLREEFRDFLTD
jgi:RNA polymerase sigma-70 factor (ECF subfamily)